MAVGIEGDRYELEDGMEDTDGRLVGRALDCEEGGGFVDYADRGAAAAGRWCAQVVDVHVEGMADEALSWVWGWWVARFA